MKNNNWLRIIILTVIVLVIAGFIKDQILKNVVSAVATKVVGTKIEMKNFHLGILSRKVDIRGFKMYQPEGFPKGIMLDIPRVRVDLDIFSLIVGKIHLPLVVFDLKEAVFITNQNKEFDVDKLKISQKFEEGKEEKPAEKKSAQSMPMQIDVVRINIGEVVLKDFSKGESPVIKAYDVAVKNKEFKNITSPQQLAVLVMVHALAPTGLRSAGLYAATTLMGVAFLPGLAAGVILADDGGARIFNASVSKIYKTTLETIQEMKGQIVSKDEKVGSIKAILNGINLSVVVKKTDKGNQLQVSGRNKLYLAKPEIAQGVIYEVEKKLK